MLGKNNSRVLISGAGELGSRYLQSMVTCSFPLTIYIHSDNLRSLEICVQRWNDAQGNTTNHKIVTYQNLDILPDHLDIAIVSSTSKSRPLLVETIAKKTSVKYWIIEKILTQNPDEIDRMLAFVATGRKCWVNYYMQGEEWYAEIKRHLSTERSMHMRVYGGEWGLACNALHFIHLHEWFADTKLTTLDLGGLSTAWHESKRPGNWEIYGQLSAKFEDGGELELLAKPGPVQYLISVRDDQNEWEIDEPAGVAHRNDGFEIKGRVPYQSERKLIEEILATGNSRLPTYESIAATDELFIRTMLKHWQQHKDSTAISVPIT